MKISVTVHAGRAAVGEIGSFDPPTVLAIGETIEEANEFRKAAIAYGKPFAISQRVYKDAGLSSVAGDEVIIQPPESKAAIAAILSESAPVPSPSWTLHGQQSRRANLRRFWTG